MFSIIKTTVLASFVTFVYVEAQNVEEKFFEQKLDHTNATSGTWKQRYLENKEFHKPGGPIFFFIGGQEFSPVTPQALQKSSMVEYAKEQGAYIFGLETRYFGQSRPTTDLSTENLSKFHTIDQSVADISEFIKELKSRPEFMNSKVVGFGTLTAGSRLLIADKEFPEIFDLVVASSSPVEAKFEFPEYLMKGVEILNKTDPECFETARMGLICLANLVQGNGCGILNLALVRIGLNMCDELNPQNTLDVAGFFQELLKNIGAVILTNNPDPMYPYNVKKLCENIKDGDPAFSFAGEIRRIVEFRNQPCMEFRFEKQIEELGKTSWDSPAVIKGERQMLWSRCRHFPNIRSTESVGLGTKIATVHFTELCQRLFSITAEDIKKNTEAVNIRYGARKIPAKCTIFVSGSDDVFQSLQITTQAEAGKCNRAIHIEGASLGKDRGEIEPEGMSYPPALRDAQIEIGKLIGEWLKTGNCCVSREPRRLENFFEFFIL